MIKYCLKKWDTNKENLKEALKKDINLNSCNYKYLVEMVVRFILNDGKLSNEEFDWNDEDFTWDSEKITVIDNGDYQGTLLFLIPKTTYQPSEYDYLMTYVNYGSCSVCDTLQSVQNWDWEEKRINDQQLNGFMSLCKDLITNMICPYNTGWRNKNEFATVEE